MTIGEDLPMDVLAALPLNGLTRSEYICKIGASARESFIFEPIDQMPVLNTWFVSLVAVHAIQRAASKRDRACSSTGAVPSIDRS